MIAITAACSLMFLAIWAWAAYDIDPQHTWQYRILHGLGQVLALLLGVLFVLSCLSLIAYGAQTK